MIHPTQRDTLLDFAEQNAAINVCCASLCLRLCVETEQDSSFELGRNINNHLPELCCHLEDRAVTTIAPVLLDHEIPFVESCQALKPLIMYCVLPSTLCLVSPTNDRARFWDWGDWRDNQPNLTSQKLRRSFKTRHHHDDHPKPSIDSCLGHQPSSAHYCSYCGDSGRGCQQPCSVSLWDLYGAASAG
jgi:hypothetical protein